MYWLKTSSLVLWKNGELDQVNQKESCFHIHSSNFTQNNRWSLCYQSKLDLYTYIWIWSNRSLLKASWICISLWRNGWFSIREWCSWRSTSKTQYQSWRLVSRNACSHGCIVGINWTQQVATFKDRSSRWCRYLWKHAQHDGEYYSRVWQKRRGMCTRIFTCGLETEMMDIDQTAFRIHCYRCCANKHLSMQEWTTRDYWWEWWQYLQASYGSDWS